jgi:hypothetical protein
MKIQVIVKIYSFTYSKIIFQWFKPKFVRKFCRDLPAERNHDGTHVTSDGGAYVACFKLLKSPSLVFMKSSEVIPVCWAQPAMTSTGFIRMDF